jgi:hypothetical protein
MPSVAGTLLALCPPRWPATARLGTGVGWVGRRTGRAPLPSLLSEPLQPGQLRVAQVERELVAIPRSPESQLVRQAEEPATAPHQADQRPIVEEPEELKLQFDRAGSGGQERRKGGVEWLRSRGQVSGSRSWSRLMPAVSSGRVS